MSHTTKPVTTTPRHLARWIAAAEHELAREVTRSAKVTRVGLLSAAADHLYGPREAKPRPTLEEMSALKAAVKARRLAELGKSQSVQRTPETVS